MNGVLLEARNIGKRFGGVQALKDVSLTIRSGEIYGLIGPNGAGKTTLFNVFTGLYPRDSGEVRFAAAPLNLASPHAVAAAGIARTFQNIRLFRSLTVLEHLLVAQSCRSASLLSQMLPFASAADAALRRQALALLEVFGLAERRDELAVHLPYGGQRRLEIARAIATAPELLLLDEPAAGLNDSETAELSGILETLRAQGYTILLVEHDMNLVMRLCSRILVLNFGRLIASGTPAEVRGSQEVIDAYLGVAD